MLIKNKITESQKKELPKKIQQFLKESQLQYNPEVFVYNTLRNISLGILKQAPHDTWIDDNCYCLCKDEIDSDGEKVYTAYQLFLDDKVRNLDKVRNVIKFLRFYAQKQGYKRLYVVSSRLDKIQAYAKGLGQHFKVHAVTFMEQIKD